MNNSTSETNAYAQFKRTMTSIVNPSYDDARAGRLDALKSNLPTLPNIDQKDSKGYSVLMLAAYHGHREIVRFLIEQGADVNACDATGNSILMGAAFKGRPEIVRMLIDAGADVTSRNPKGLTALDFAVMFGRSEVVLLLSSVSERKGKRWLRAFVAWVKFLVPVFHRKVKKGDLQ